MSSCEPMRGAGLFVRRYLPRHHGTMDAFAKRYVGVVSHVMVGGLWQDPRRGKKTFEINTARECRELVSAFKANGIEAHVWVYPWLGQHEELLEWAAKVQPVKPDGFCIDAELGANPSKSRSGAQKLIAEIAARETVRGFAKLNSGAIGLSTYGSGVKLGWFPANAYSEALAKYAPGRSYAGGQTYTRDDLIDDHLDVWAKHCKRHKIQLLPAFGTYDRTKLRRVHSRSAASLRKHVAAFDLHDADITAAVAWAENFVTDEQIPELTIFNESLLTGASFAQCAGRRIA